MGSIETFQEQRPRLLSVAYRMLGTVADAEDVVQETWLRWSAQDPAAVRDVKAWLSVTATRLCLDKLKAVRSQRDAYRGPWLPEPVITDAPIEREAISLAFLVLLERLTPVERAVYLLHQVFEYPHQEVAVALDMTESAVRQAFHRAKQHVAANRPRFMASQQDHARLLQAFAQALMRGDLAALTQVLAKDATLWADGGGKVRGAAGRPVHGGDAIARFLTGLVTKLGVAPDLTLELRQVNGWPALVARRGDRVDAVVAIETDGRRILTIRNIVNPEKLALVRVD